MFVTVNDANEKKNQFVERRIRFAIPIGHLYATTIVPFFFLFFFFLQSSRFLLALYCRVETIGYLKHINDRYKQKWTREIILLSRRRTIDIVFPL